MWCFQLNGISMDQWKLPGTVCVSPCPAIVLEPPSVHMRLWEGKVALSQQMRPCPTLLSCPSPFPHRPEPQTVHYNACHQTQSSCSPKISVVYLGMVGSYSIIMALYIAHSYWFWTDLPLCLEIRFYAP